MALSLNSTQLKIERAEKHIRDLREILLPWIDSHPQKLRIDPDPDGVHELVKVVQVRDIPSDVYLIAGDAVHNLRSALDIMLCAFARHENIRELNLVEFPFGWSLDDFAKPTKQGKVEMLGPDVVRWIAELEPYKGGDDFFHALHVLDCSDKHRELLPVFYRSTGVLLVENPDGVMEEVPSGWCPFKKEMVIERRVIGTYPKNKLQWRMMVSFNEPSAVENRSMLYVLDDFVKKVKAVVADFEGLCPLFAQPFSAAKP